MTTYDLIGPNVPEGKIRISPANLTVQAPLDLTTDELIRLSQLSIDALREAGYVESGYVVMPQSVCERLLFEAGEYRCLKYGEC